MIERAKFNILEIQENFENFLDKKEMALEVSFNVNFVKFTCFEILFTKCHN